VADDDQSIDARGADGAQRSEQDRLTSQPDELLRKVRTKPVAFAAGEDQRMDSRQTNRSLLVVGCRSEDMAACVSECWQGRPPGVRYHSAPPSRPA